jgi:hypothetical protein
MPDNKQNGAYHNLGPRSRLVSAFFDHLNTEGVAYAVMNNYEELPWVIPSDVDFTIPTELFSRLDGFVLDFANSEGAFVVQKLWHGNQKSAYILCVGPEGAREFVQLDFFVAFSTKGCPALFTHEELIADHRRLRNFYVPNPAVELIFTAMRRLFKDDWSERHCARIAELHGRIAECDWLPPRYAWLHETLDAAIRGDLATVRSRRAGDWARLRQSARVNMSLRDRVANAALQARRIAVRLRDETGHLVVVTGPSGLVTATAMDVLELVFHRKMYIDEETLATKSVLARMSLAARLALLKRRKGLVFLLVQPGQRLSPIFARWLDRLGLLDQLFKVAPGPDRMALKAPTNVVVSTADSIEAIITTQAEKTARAIARGGTQTSG